VDEVKKIGVNQDRVRIVQDSTIELSEVATVPIDDGFFNLNHESARDTKMKKSQRDYEKIVIQLDTTLFWFSKKPFYSADLGGFRPRHESCSLKGRSKPEKGKPLERD